MTYTIKCAAFLAITAMFIGALFTGQALAIAVWLIERVWG